MTLPNVVRSGRDAVLRLGAAVTETETSDHLVEDQQRADSIAFVAQTLEEAGGGGNDPHVGGDRLDDDCGHLIVELGNDVVRHHQRVGDGTGRNAGGAGQAQCGDAASAGSEQCIGRTVEVAVEDHEAIATCVPTRQSHGRAGRLGA